MEWVLVSELLPVLEDEIRKQEIKVSYVGENGYFQRRLHSYRAGKSEYTQLATAERMLSLVDSEWRVSELNVIFKGGTRFLKDKEITAIRKKYKDPWTTQKMLAIEYNVSQWLISKVVRSEPGYVKRYSRHYKPRKKK